MSQASRSRRTAVLALTAACALWGFSFPVMKALQSCVDRVLPGVSSWFVAAGVVGARFLAGALALFAIERARPTRSEARQGIALGLATGVGMLLQTDALAYTEASTAAFLTQAYVFMLPPVSFALTRKAPSLRVWVCAAVVVLGLAILARFDPRTLALGRGEAETLLAAACFTLQILLLDVPAFAHNRATQVTQLMFLTIAAIALPVAALTARSFAELTRGAAAPGVAGCFAFIVTLPTLGSFMLMNRYQRAVSASEAGIVYATEPVFASALALWLPGLLSRWIGIHYPNEIPATRLLLGGCLVLVANVILALPERAAIKPQP